MFCLVLDTFRYDFGFWIHLDTFGYVWICLDTFGFGYACTCLVLDTFGYVWIRAASRHLESLGPWLVRSVRLPLCLGKGVTR